MSTRTVIAVAALVLATSPAQAEEPRSPGAIPPKARALAEQGRAFHETGDYGNAIVAFKEAYVMAPSPGLLFNLAQAYRLQGNCADAAMMYRRYLDTAPNLEARRIADAHLASVERCAQRGMILRVDASAGALRPPAADGVTVFADSPAVKRAELAQNIGLGLTIGGGIALGAATYFALDARSAATSVEEAYANGAKWRDVEATDARGKRSARTAKIFAIGGGAGVLGGVTVYLLGKRAERLAPISVIPTARGAEVKLTWQF